MFQVITISASPERGHVLRHLVHATGQLMPVREMELPLDEVAVRRVLNLHHPDVILVDLSGGDDGALAVYLVKRAASDVPVVGIGGTNEIRASVDELGVTAFTAEKPEPGELLSAVGAALHRSCGGVEESLLSFLPAKAGNGCTTVVMNTAVALARLGRKVVVVEADLRSGVLPILLDRVVKHPLQSLLADSAEIDGFRVENCVVRAHGVDWLLSSRSIDARLPCWFDYYRLLEVLKKKYDYVLVDLPELVNVAGVGSVRRSRQVYAVCTPEVHSLRLCAHRLEELAYWSVPSERIALVVNRWHPQDLAAARIEEMIGRPVAQVLPNSYLSARAATNEAREVDPESKLGQAFTQFACLVAGEAYAPAGQGFAGRLRSVFSK